MKRSAFVSLSLLSLCACTRAGALQPAEVLQKAIVSSQSLTSARYSLQFAYDGMTSYFPGKFHALATANGMLQDGGRQLTAAVDANIKRIDQQGIVNVMKIRSSFVSVDQKTTYVKVDQWDIQPPTPLISEQFITSVVGRWITLPNNESATGSTTPMLSADPSLLRAQASVISVTQDRGIEKLNGHDSYAYDVTIDPEKVKDFFKSEIAELSPEEAQTQLDMLRSAKGKVWIDEQSFHIRRIVWDIVTNSANNPSTLHIDINVSDHNDESIVVTPPTNSATFSSDVSASGSSPSAND